jgi:hypothetical protein
VPSASEEVVPRVPHEVRQRLQTLFLQALAARAVLALGLHTLANDALFAPDQATYDYFGALFARYWSGEIVTQPWRMIPAGFPLGYPFIVGVLYFAFGLTPLVPKLVNCVVGAALVPVAFDLTLRTSASTTAALRAATFVAWFPSLILWSALNIRDAWIVLLVALICREALALQERFTMGGLAILAGAVLAVVQFRTYILLAVAGPMVVSFFVRRSSQVGRNALIGMIAAVVVIYADQSAGTGRKLRTLDLEELSEIRHWNTVGATSRFEYADISTPGRALAYLPTGLAYFLLAPFPWMLGSIRQTLAIPETLFFYWLIPWIFRGVIHLLRLRLGASILPILVTAGLTLGYALGEGNAGTAYRHRAQIIVFFLIFAAVGLDQRKKAKAAPLSAAAPRPEVQPRWNRLA